MTEIFRDIPNYEGLYQVSNIGRVKSLKFGKEKILKSSKDAHGYFLISLHKNKKRKTHKVHQLVAIVFLNHKPNKFKIVVDHIDNDKTNNCVDNLQLITNRENVSKNINSGKSKYKGVSWNNANNKWRSRIFINGKSVNLGSFENEIEAAEAYQKALKTKI